MNQDDHKDSYHDSKDDVDDDEHEHDMVMPGFRFHPTEEELVEFYLRRKVEGKRFNVDLITFLDLYRYDPWELPAIGEKEWFFYVPRDRKYRNGDRPNRVTTSGYWKATGADRMIRSDNLRSIGLKKTLVFYSGKAPKGIRSSWIMNEYRLPHHETERLQKAEISLCRVYKRPGVEEYSSHPPRSSLPTRSSAPMSRSSSDKKPKHDLAPEKLQKFVQQIQQGDGKISVKTSGNSTSTDIGTALGLSNLNSYVALDPLPAATISPLSSNINVYSTPPSLLVPLPNAIDELHRLISFQQASVNQHHNNVDSPNIINYQSTQFCSDHVQLPAAVVPQSQSLAFSMLHGGTSVQAACFPDRLWDNSITGSAASKDYVHERPF